MSTDALVTYCCAVFRETLESRGQGGLAVVPRRSRLLGLYFDLEFRALAEENDDVLLNPSRRDVKVYRQGNHAIAFCPWCGTNLKQFYENQERGLRVREEDAWWEDKGDMGARKDLL